MSSAIRRALIVWSAAAAFAPAALRAQQQVDVIERPLADDGHPAGEPAPAPMVATTITPAEVRGAFENLRQVLQLMVDAFAAAAEMGFAQPGETVQGLAYRIGLVDRYLRIHTLFENQTALEHPGPIDPVKGRLDPRRGDPRIRPLDRDDLLAVAAEYVALLQEKPPSSAGTFHTGVRWQDAQGRLYFATAHEGERVRMALTLGAIDTVREGIRQRRNDAAELPLGVTQMLPGGAIAQLAYIAGAGRTIQGAQVGLLQRVLAIGGIALEMLPVVTPLVKAGLGGAGAGGLPRGVQKELLAYLKDRSALVKRLGAGPANPRNAVYEQMQADWLKHLDALHGRRSTSISISREGISVHGEPTPARGIDMYAYERSSRTAPGIVRELKLKRGFDGNWTRSATGLDRIKTTSLQTREIRDAVSRAGAAEVDQLSWTWTLDRALTRHRTSIERARLAANDPVARAAALEQAADAEHLLRRFADGRLQRQLCVMNAEGEVHVRAGMLGGGKDDPLSGLIAEALPTPMLQQLARDYLAGQ